MHSLRISIVYPSGYAPTISSDGILAIYPVIDNTHPIKIGLKVAGTHTNNCRTQHLLLTHLVFDEVDKAEKFCRKALPMMQNDNEDKYYELVDSMLKSQDMQSIGHFRYK